MVFTSVSGHLMSVDFNENLKGWKSCDPSILVDRATPIRKFVPENMKNIERSLTQEARNCRCLVLWLDGDLEGENIAFEVIEVCQKSNPSLRFDGNNNTILRARFSEITERAMRTTINNLVKPNPLESAAVDARQEIDLRTGAAFTRFQTITLCDKYNLPKNTRNSTIVSFGTCQFPTLGFIVERQMEREKFVSEKFWKIDVDYEEKEQKCSFYWTRFRLFCRLTTLVFFCFVMENPIATVTQVRSQRRTRLKPLPLNTIELQKLGTRHLRMSGHQIMEVAERLYNQGIISYPRTETNLYKLNDAEIQTIIRGQTAVATNPWTQYAQGLLNNGNYERPRNGRKDDNAHPPIHPVKAVSLNGLEGNERRVYDMICRHFLACCSKNAIGQETNVTIEISEETFKTKGLMIIERNYLEIYPFESWTKKTIPVFRKDQRFTPSGIFMREGSTQAPQLLTERDLITKMDQNGIGTDATIAQHIQKIQDRQYCRKENNRFRATNLGLGLIEAYNRVKLSQIVKPELRKKIEVDMKSICRGQLNKDVMLDQNMKLYGDIFKEVMKKKELFENEVGRFFQGITTNAVVMQRNFSNCGVCNNGMDLKEVTRGNLKNKYLDCPACSKSFELPFTGDFSSESKRCKICNFQVLKVTKNPGRGRGGESKSHFICPHCFKNHPPDIEDLNVMHGFRCFMCSRKDCELAGRKGNVGICPVCNKNQLRVKKKKNGKPFIGCSGFRNAEVACSQAYWFSDNVIDLELSDDDKCTQCNNAKIKIKFDGGAAGSVVCLRCDELKAVGIETSNKAQTSVPAKRRFNNNPRSNFGGNNNNNWRNQNNTNNFNNPNRKYRRINNQRIGNNN